MARWDKGNQNIIPDWFWHAVDVEAEARHVEVEEGLYLTFSTCSGQRRDSLALRA